jgi:hypothetical protein
MSLKEEQGQTETLRQSVPDLIDSGDPQIRSNPMEQNLYRILIPNGDKQEGQCRLPTRETEGQAESNMWLAHASTAGEVVHTPRAMGKSAAACAMHHTRR